MYENAPDKGLFLKETFEDLQPFFDRLSATNKQRLKKGKTEIESSAIRMTLEGIKRESETKNKEFNVYLVRHGETEYNTLIPYETYRRVYSPDTPLTGNGIAQAKKVRQQLDKIDVDAVVYSSDYARARETASYLGSGVKICEDLREIDGGKLEKMTALEYFGSDVAADEFYKRYRTDPNTSFPSGETKIEVSDRLSRALKEVCETEQRGIIAVSHGGAIRQLLMNHFGLSMEQASVSNCDIIQLKYKDGQISFVQIINKEKGKMLDSRMRRFQEIFDDHRTQSFVDQVYAPIASKAWNGDVEIPKNIPEKVTEFLKWMSPEYSDLTVLTGMPGSGKTTLVLQSQKEKQREVISTDSFIAEFGKLCSERNFPAAAHNDDFRKHELKVIASLLICGEFDGCIFDFGGGALMQPALSELCKALPIRVINLEIDDEERVANLAKDVIELGDKSFRGPLKNIINEKFVGRKNKLEEIKQAFEELTLENTELTSSTDKLRKFIEYRQDLEAELNEIKEAYVAFDSKNRWRKMVYAKAAEPVNFKEAKAAMVSSRFQ